MKKLLRANKAKIIISSIIIIVVIFAIFSNKNKDENNIITAIRGDIITETLLTGTVKPARSAMLSFDRNGIISYLYAQTGSRVNAGALLASLKNDSEVAAVAEARATREVAQTALSEILRGARKEETNIKEASVKEKETVFKNLTEKSSALIADAYSTSDESLNRYADPLFSNDDSNSPRLTFSSGNQSGVYEAELLRVSAGNALANLRTRTTAYNVSAETALEYTLEDLRKMMNLFISLDTVLNTGSGLSESTLSDYKEKIATARGKIVTSITGTQNHLNALRESASALQKAESELALSVAGSTKEEVKKADEGLAQADAKLNSAEASLEKTFIRAPFNGVITSRNAVIGETISAGENIITIEGESGFVIESDVPEADIAKIKTGDEAEITLDAYGSDVFFKAKISEIEHSEKIIEGVPTYKTTFTFLKRDDRLRSGMTANITIATAKKLNVLTLPIRSIERINEKYFATVLKKDGGHEKREVTLGIRGSNGLVEIISGVSEDEKVFASPGENN